MNWVVGVDEVGRGSLAGPVITCAVLWSGEYSLAALNDSKKLSAKKREFLQPFIEKAAIRTSFGRAEVAEIDYLNILRATMLAMERAVGGLNEFDAPILIDGNIVPSTLKGRAKAIIGGDGLIPAISAASILAKVARDEEMSALAKTYPGYGFEKHAGYPTRAHIEALGALGVSPIHRRSFAPVKKLLEKE